MPSIGNECRVVFSTSVGDLGVAFMDEFIGCIYLHGKPSNDGKVKGKDFSLPSHRWKVDVEAS